MSNAKFKGAIFDFNGTLFFDSDKHEKAWKKFSADVRGYPFTDEEMVNIVHGRTNRAILEYLLEREIPDDVLMYFTEKKENYYKHMCLQDRNNLKLVDGAEALFDYLLEKGIGITIATASEATNLQFFNEQFHLDRWFDMEKIVYDDYKIPGKPAPDMFLKVAKNLSLTPEECLLFEDSESGIKAAQAAAIGKIIIVDPKPGDSRFLTNQSVDAVISDFTQFDPNNYF